MNLPKIIVLCQTDKLYACIDKRSQVKALHYDFFLFFIWWEHDFWYCFILTFSFYIIVELNIYFEYEYLYLHTTDYRTVVYKSDKKLTSHAVVTQNIRYIWNVDIFKWVHGFTIDVDISLYKKKVFGVTFSVIDVADKRVHFVKAIIILWHWRGIVRLGFFYYGQLS